ncbi:hypothetical protein FGG79_21460, partial [Bacillus sp. BHET2]
MPCHLPSGVRVGHALRRGAQRHAGIFSRGHRQARSARDLSYPCYTSTHVTAIPEDRMPLSIHSFLKPTVAALAIAGGGAVCAQGTP